MAPLADYLCSLCSYMFEEYSQGKCPTMVECPHCETRSAEKLPSACGGYKIKGNNSASVTPKGAGAFKGKVK